MKKLLLVMILILFSGCATLTTAQKERIADERTNRIIDQNRDALGAEPAKQEEIKKQYIKK